MLCTLAFLSWGYVWIDGANQLSQYCYYDCNSGRAKGYDKVYRVPFNYNCPARIVFA